MLYIVEVALMQEVTLPRGVKTRTLLQSATWWVNSLGMSGPDRLRTGATTRWRSSRITSSARSDQSIHVSDHEFGHRVIWSSGHLVID